MSRYYYSFNEYLRKRFKTKVHRLSLNAGFTCPHRDGTLGSDGCYYCNENGFANFKDTKISLREQIITSMQYTRKRFKAEKFIAYFQNATNTYASTEELQSNYDVIREFPDIVGLSISTRPDCIDDEKLDLVESYSSDYDVWIEYGLQSIHDKTLKLINRQHDAEQFINAVKITLARNIKTAAHVILGLPGESKTEMIETAKALSLLDIHGLKIHAFHILGKTRFHQLFDEGKIRLLKEDEYVRIVCDFLEYIKPKCVIMRLVSNADKNVLIAPPWINNKQKILQAIENEFERRNTSQGSKTGSFV